MPPGGEWLFGRYRLLTASRQLQVDERSRELDPRAFAVLECLLRRPEAVVPRAELIAMAWPGMRVVPDSAVSKVMRRLRLALGDAHGTVLQTIYGEGYRLALPATLLPLPPRPPRLEPVAVDDGAAWRRAPPGAADAASAASEAGTHAVPQAAPASPLPPVAASRLAPARAGWRMWLPWSIALASTLVAAWLAWLLLRGPGAG